MRAEQIHGFRDLMLGTLEIYGAATTVNALRIWWDVLKPYELDDVRTAFMAHIATSQTAPMPAEILRILTSQGGGHEPF